MAETVIKTDKDLCRCCHSEGSFHSLIEPRSIRGQPEFYMDMLKNCLDIELLPVGDLLCVMTICDSCIFRLRDATKFKKQVLQCEERFKEMYKNFTKVMHTEFEVKQEVPVIDENDVKEEFIHLERQDDDDGNFDDDSDEDHPLIKIKIEGSKKKNVNQTKQKPKAKKKRKNETETEIPDDEVAELTEKKDKTRGVQRHPKFVLKDSDYRNEGENYTCTHCGKKYDKYFSLRFHIKTKHYKIPRFLCPYCVKEFMTPAPLTIHKLEEHNIDERFKCKACNAAFNTKVQLRKHINNFHMLGEKYKCEFCEYESFSFEGMYKHKFKHKTVKDYHCRFCRKSFLRKATLDLHERIHTGDRRKVCKMCGQAFVQKASLNYHMTKYHPEVNF